ncbi:MAG: hypothetical protein H6706_19075 [Myxococcales bacterium]|nr:hypothetical protein [Myxococcales bacterium]
MRRRVLLCGLLVGCTPLLDLEGPARLDGEVADFTVDSAMTPPLDAVAPADAAAVDAGREAQPDVGRDARPPPDAAADASALCPPGTRLDLCVGCDAEGAVVALPDDDACPVTCPTTYRLTDGVCYALAGEPVARCRSAGVCEDDADRACAQGEPEPIAQAGPCQRMTGCRGDTPPQLLPAPDATPCGVGVCVDGACQDAAGACAFPDAYVLCRAELEDEGTILCHVRPADDSLVTCGAVCEAGGAVCVGSMQTLPGLDACAGGFPHGCGEPLATPACACRVGGD